MLSNCASSPEKIVDLSTIYRKVSSQFHEIFLSPVFRRLVILKQTAPDVGALPHIKLLIGKAKMNSGLECGIELFDSVCCEENDALEVFQQP